MQQCRIYLSRALLAIILLIASVPAARAESSADGPTFAEGEVTFNTTLGYVAAYGSDDADIAAMYLGANYFIAERFSLGAELGGYGVGQPGDDAVGIGLSGIFRHHLFDWEQSTLFLEGSFGPVYISRSTPEAGTHFNFISRLGAGMTFEMDEGAHLMAGARWWHLSNAQIDGVDRNPTINGVEFYIGLVWRR